MHILVRIFCALVLSACVFTMLWDYLKQRRFQRMRERTKSNGFVNISKL